METGLSLNDDAKVERLHCCLVSEREASDVNSRDDDGASGLVHAARINHTECARTLIRKGADVNIQDRTGKTALIHAVRQDNTDIVKRLINKTADVNIRDSSGQTALMYSIRIGNIEIFTSLINKKADVNVQDNNGMTPLSLSCEMGRAQLCELLKFHKCDLNIQDNEGQTALMHAVRGKAVALSKQTCLSLCASSADVNIQDRSGMTALMYAARQNPGVCEVLSRQGRVQVNLKDNNGRTALMHASCMLQWEACEVLLKRKADVSIEDNNSMTALTHALYTIVNYPTLYSDRAKNGLRIGELLVEYGSNTALNWEISSLLMDKSASKGALAVGNLMRRGYSGLVRLMISNGIMDAEFGHQSSPHRPIQSVVECAAIFGHIELLRYMMRKCYLTEGDLKYIRLVGSRRSGQQSEECESGCPEFSNGNAARPTDTSSGVTPAGEDVKRLNVSREVRCVLEEITGQVWSLRELALITITTALGSDEGRSDRIDALPLPPKMKRMLKFQD